ncbi:MAG: PD-(D/E)XK nuclease family protein [Bacilli bacterium]|nr:PD-(D/E)XK nuclease family protein [Bacilli bacterium]
MSKLYLIMNTFSGRYLGERNEKNIGHENINFFVPDECEGKHLIWFNSDGIIPAYRLSHATDIRLLMVTNFAGEKDKFRVLAYAKNLHPINGVSISGQSMGRKNERYCAFNTQFPRAKYGETPLRLMFADNTYGGFPDGENTLATFYMDPIDMKVPNGIHFIKIKKNANGNEIDDDSFHINQNMSNETMRLYVSENNIERFEDIVRNIEWMDYDQELREFPGYPKNGDHFTVADSLFLATGNEKDELSVSNMIAFLFGKSPELLSSFCSFLLRKKGIDRPFYLAEDGSFSIEREDKHVDLTMRFPTCTFVIENKIDSEILDYSCSINVLKEKILSVYSEYKPERSPSENSRRSTILKYEEKVRVYNAILNKIDDELESISDGDRICQLTKYYIQSLVDAFIQEREDLPIYRFVLVPDYKADKPIYNNGYVNGRKFGEEYKVIKYSELKAVFESVDGYPFRNDVLNELEILSSRVDDMAQRYEIRKFLKKSGL